MDLNTVIVSFTLEDLKNEAEDELGRAITPEELENIYNKFLCMAGVQLITEEFVTICWHAVHDED
jgi:hypothetical protein